MGGRPLLTHTGKYSDNVIHTIRIHIEDKTLLTPQEVDFLKNLNTGMLLTA